MSWRIAHYLRVPALHQRDVCLGSAALDSILVNKGFEPSHKNKLFLSYESGVVRNI